MAISISKANEKEFGTLTEKMWREIDIEHYGEPVTWVIKNFLFKATDDGKIVGRIEGVFEAGVLFIDSLIVMRTSRNKGIGKKLLTKAEEFCMELGGHKIFLFTMEQWDAAKFYERLGYIKSGDLPNHFLKRDFIIYSKILT